MEAVEKGRRGAGWATIGVALLVALLHLAWFSWDRRIPFMDQHRYYRMSVQATHCLDGSGDAGPLGLLTLEGSHPPLYPILGSLAMLITGDGYPAARMINVALAALVVLSAFLLGRRGLSPWSACLAATLAAFAPLLFAFGHVYYIESLLVPLVLLTWWWTEASDGLARPRSWIGMGLLLGLGCLAKWTYPVFVGVPLLLAVRKTRRWTSLLPTVGVAAIIAAPWYVTNFSNVVAFFERGVVAGEGHLSAHPGLMGWLYYPKELILVGLGLPFSAAVIAGWIAVSRQDRARALKLMTWALVPVLVFSVVMTKKPRHLLPVIPILAIVAVHGALAVRNQRLRTVLVGLLVAHVATSALQGSFRLVASDPVVRIGGAGIPLLSEPSPVPGPPEDATWPYEQILRALGDAGATDPRHPVLLLFNLTAFREDGFWYTRDELKRGGFHLGSMQLGLIPFSWPPGHEARRPFPLHRVADDTPGLLDARYVVAKTGRIWVRYGTGLRLHEHGARVSEALLDPDSLLRQAFRPLDEFPLPDGSTAVLFVATDSPERTQQITAWARLAHEVDDLRTAFRIGDDPAGAAIKLARRDPGNTRSVMRWLRRALEADRDSEDRVRDAARELALEAPSFPRDLLAWLRQRDRDR
ncbi:MAG: glycosyltransferase family 39 protein [Planctomycetota bacterium]|nr:glycosyltransferase family 39 protein [Planctomycetota bacterium]